MSTTRIRRVSKSRPCPICNADKWCGIAGDGGFCICMRIAQGSIKRTKNVGYFHLLDGHPRRRSSLRVIEVNITPTRRNDLALLARRFQTAISPLALVRLAANLGVSAESLRRLGIGWATREDLQAAGTNCRDAGCFTFPMTDAAGAVRGMRLRSTDGFKFAITGGSEGLFIPAGLTEVAPLLVCEGATDCAALLDLGFNAIGRPSCTGGMGLLVELVRVRRSADVVIVADSDEPGQRGAESLACVLVAYLPRVRIITPPQGIKDARAWKAAGATAADVQGTIDAATIKMLTVTSRIVGSQRAGMLAGRAIHVGA